MTPMLAAVSGSAVVPVVYLLALAFELAAAWRLFRKAGRPGWAAIVPLYGTYVLVRIAGRSGWWVLLLLLPVVNLVALAIVVYDLSRSFGRGAGFALGLYFLSFVFVPVLAFGSATYGGLPGGGPGARGRLASR